MLILQTARSETGMLGTKKKDPFQYFFLKISKKGAFLLKTASIPLTIIA